MRKKNLASAIAMSLGILVAPPVLAGALISIVPSSPLIGPEICKPGYASPQCLAIPFDTGNNLAFQGGSALPAVAKDNITMDYNAIHQPEFANDGHYGNGASWVSDSVNSWLKIDLGQTILINRLTFGRDRMGGFDDRDSGQFTIAVSTSDNIYANGDDSNDGTEYTQVVDSAVAGFSGIINGAETVQVSFAPVLARFVKLTVADYGTAIDEIEVFAPKDEGPLSVTIDHFSATRNSNGKVKIKLVTGSETQTAILSVVRAPTILQNLQQIQEICQWDGVGTEVSGSVYSCNDENAPANVVYWPVEVENNGVTNSYLEFVTNVQ